MAVISLVDCWVNLCPLSQLQLAVVSRWTRLSGPVWRSPEIGGTPPESGEEDFVASIVMAICARVDLYSGLRATCMAVDFGILLFSFINVPRGHGGFNFY